MLTLVYLCYKMVAQVWIDQAINVHEIKGGL